MVYKTFPHEIKIVFTADYYTTNTYLLLLAA